jgi:hypothetical protein
MRKLLLASAPRRGLWLIGSYAIIGVSQTTLHRSLEHASAEARLHLFFRRLWKRLEELGHTAFWTNAIGRSWQSAFSERRPAAHAFCPSSVGPLWRAKFRGVFDPTGYLKKFSLNLRDVAWL